MTDGVEIRIRGRLGVYGPQGQLQLKMSAIDPDYTLGRLASRTASGSCWPCWPDGLLDAQRRPAPCPATAARRAGDQRRQRGRGRLPARARPAADSGSQVRRGRRPGAGPRRRPRSVTAALARLVGLGVDVVAIVRGGGARTDLAAFDSELAWPGPSPPPGVPVLTGIGHEIDTSVADQVAHLACKTPTACAAHLVGRPAQFHLRVDETCGPGLTTGDRRSSDSEHARVHHRRHGGIGVPAPLAVADARRPPRRPARRRLGRAGRSVGPGAGCASVAREPGGRPRGDPARTLARGWSITRTATGELVRDPAQVTAGDVPVTTLAGGSSRHSRVIEPSNDASRPERGRARQPVRPDSTTAGLRRRAGRARGDPGRARGRRGRHRPPGRARAHGRPSCSSCAGADRGRRAVEVTRIVAELDATDPERRRAGRRSD